MHNNDYSDYIRLKRYFLSYFLPFHPYFLPFHRWNLLSIAVILLGISFYDY